MIMLTDDPEKDPHAVALGRQRWANVPAAERSRLMSALAKLITPEAARERALKAWETKRGL